MIDFTGILARFLLVAVVVGALLGVGLWELGCWISRHLTITWN